MFHWFRKHTEDGLEVPDPTPIEIPLAERPLTLSEQMQRFITDPSASKLLRERGIDTFDEADDFDIVDPEGCLTPYEAEFNDDEVLSVQTRVDELKSGIVEEIPSDRQNDVRDRVDKKRRPLTEPKKEESK